MTRNCALDVPNIRTTTVDEILSRTCFSHGHFVTSVIETMHSSSATVLLSLRLRCLRRLHVTVWPRKCQELFAYLTSLLMNVASGYVDPYPWSFVLRSLQTCRELVTFPFLCTRRDHHHVHASPPSPVLSSTDHVFVVAQAAPLLFVSIYVVRGHTRREDAWLLACPHISLVGAGDRRYPNRHQRKHWDCML